MLFKQIILAKFSKKYLIYDRIYRSNLIYLRIININLNVIYYDV